MKSEKDRQQNIIPFAWYKPTQWARLLEVSEDAGELERTYLEWIDGATKRINDMARAGLRVQRVDVDVDEIVEWCRRRAVPVNGSSRALYLAEKAREEW